MISRIISLTSGIIFGVGLSVSNMINPEKVLGFLDLFGQWDPSLIFVMMGAIIVSAPIFFLYRNKNKPLFADNFAIPTIPHPMPNVPEPIIKFLSIDFRVGIAKLSANKGLFLFLNKKNTGALTIIATIITKIKEGSH